MAMIDAIATFQEVHKYEASQILEMTLWDKECYIWSYNECVQGAESMEHI